MAFFTNPDGSQSEVPDDLINQGMAQLGAMPPGPPPGPQSPVPFPPAPPVSPVSAPSISVPKINDPTGLTGLATDAANQRLGAEAASINANAQQNNAGVNAKEKLYQGSADQEAQDYASHQARIADIQAKGQQIENMARAWANTNVDPRGFVADTGTWGKIALGISLAAGGFLAPDNHGQNIALNTINTLVDKDVQAKEKQLARQGDVIKMMGEGNASDLAAEKQTYSDAQDHRVKLLALAEKQVDTELTRTTDAGAQAQLMKLKAGLLDEIAKTATEAAKIGSAQKVAQIEAGPRYAEVAEKKREDIENLPSRTFELGAKVGLQNAEAKRAETAGTGEIVYNPITKQPIGPVPKGPEGAKIKEATSNYVQATQLANKLSQTVGSLSFADKVAGKVGQGSAQYKEAASDYGRLMNLLQGMAQRGGDRINKTTLESIKQQAGKGTELFSGDPEELLQETRKNLRNTIMDLYGVNGLDASGLVNSAEGTSQTSVPGVTATQLPNGQGTKFSF